MTRNNADFHGSVDSLKSPEKFTNKDVEFTFTPAHVAGEMRHKLSAWKGNDYLGYITWHKTSGVVTHIQTQPKFRRQGVATMLWKTAKTLPDKYPGTTTPKHDYSDQTPEGAAWAKKVGD